MVNSQHETRFFSELSSFPLFSLSNLFISYTINLWTNLPKINVNKCFFFFPFLSMNNFRKLTRYNRMARYSHNYSSLVRYNQVLVYIVLPQLYDEIAISLLRIFTSNRKRTLHKKWSFPLKILFSKYDQICRKLRIWSRLLK